MRVFAIVLSFLGLLLTAGLPAGGAQAGRLAAPGPNPNWTDMQQFEWYLGYMSRAARVCGTHVEADVLHRLARMSPYGDIGLGAVMGDGFAGPVCGGINNEVKELAADAAKIQAYLEGTYNCEAEGCYGQKLSDWKFHACADPLKSHLASRAVEDENLREVTITNVRRSGATLDFQARVRLKTCEGSLYVDLTESCRVEKEYTRGDCEIDGVEGY
jgi:hypothetical protein